MCTPAPPGFPQTLPAGAAPDPLSSCRPQAASARPPAQPARPLRPPAPPGRPLAPIPRTRLVRPARPRPARSRTSWLGTYCRPGSSRCPTMTLAARARERWRRDEAGCIMERDQYRRKWRSCVWPLMPRKKLRAMSAIPQFQIAIRRLSNLDRCNRCGAARSAHGMDWTCPQAVSVSHARLVLLVVVAGLFALVGVAVLALTSTTETNPG